MAMALSEKLMLERLEKRLLLNMPADVGELDGWKFDTECNGSYDMILKFIFDIEELKSTLQSVSAGKQINPNGLLFFAYPKKGNKRYKDYIERDALFPIIGIEGDAGCIEGTTLKFNKLFSFNDVFTVVGFKYDVNKPKEHREPPAAVENFKERIPDLKAALAKSPDVQAIYEKLPFGYQKDWARFIYSAKSPEVKGRRMQELETILRAGFKSKDLYRASQQPRKQ